MPAVPPLGSGAKVLGTQELGEAVSPSAPTSYQPSLDEQGLHLPIEVDHSIESATGLRVARADGQTTILPASNLQLGNRALAEFIGRRPPAVQLEIDRRITKSFADDEQTFEVKDEQTHRYRTHTVPIHAIIAPIDGDHFDRLVQSTGPVMRACRELLRVVYSKPNFTAEDLGIQDLPAKDRDVILNVLRTSLYFEKRLVADTMSEYPFLAVAGFDAALGDPHAPVFFECNFGTPAGIETNIQLQEKLRLFDPEQLGALAPHLRKDDTFQVLKNVIEDNALAWTKNPNGISVMVSPGPSSAGHQDSTATAELAGMPLVVPQDLYQDERGWIRLDTGDPNSAQHPIVTGIYSRAEESWLLQNPEDGIHFRSPDFWENAEIGKRLGIELENGVPYYFRHGANREVVGVSTDHRGQPMAASPEFRIGKGSLARALKDRKLYISCVGGRTADDKRLFEIVSRHLAPRFAKEGDPIARPPTTIPQSEYVALMDEPDLSGYVVKEPDRSGGDGVHVLATKSEAERKHIVDHLDAHGDRVIVQKLATAAVTVGAENEADPKYGTLAIDGRLIVMFDSKGEVHSGPNALMLRTSWPGGMMCNMSRGGGLTPVAVLDDDRRKVSLEDSLFPAPKAVDHVGKSDRAAFKSFLEQLNQLIEQATAGTLRRHGGAGRAASTQRRIMHLAGMINRPLMAMLRAFDAGTCTEQELQRELVKTRDRLVAGDGPTASCLEADIKAVLG